MSQRQHIYINKSLLILRMSPVSMHPCKMDRMEGVQFPFEREWRKKKQNTSSSLLWWPAGTFWRVCAAHNPALQRQGRWFTFQKRLRACHISHLLQTNRLNDLRAQAERILPLWCRVRTVQLCPSCPASLLCPVGSIQNRPLCQTGSTLGRDDGWLPGWTQLGWSRPSTNEQPHHECTFLHERHLKPGGKESKRSLKCRFLSLICDCDLISTLHTLSLSRCLFFDTVDTLFIPLHHLLYVCGCTVI